MPITPRFVAAALLAGWRQIATVTVAAGALTLAGSFLLPNKYTSQATFLPEVSKSSRIPGNLAGLASQFGLNLGEEGNESPAFYADLAYSREVMTRVLFLKVPNYRAADPRADSVLLIDLLKVKAGSEARRLEKGILKLAKMMSVDANTKTNVITLRITAPWPGLAQDLVAADLRIINDFNLRRRTSRAATKREFVEVREREAAQELQRREDALRRFQMENRQTASSPTLQTEERALERQISIAQEVYLVVRRELEMTRMNEVNNTPVITTIDQPSMPGRKSAPHRLTLAVFAAVLAAIGAAAVLLLRDAGVLRALREAVSRGDVRAA